MGKEVASTNEAGAVTETEGLLDQIVEESRVAKSDEEHRRAKDIISELAKEVMEGTVVVSDNLNMTLDARIAELDRLISEQLSAVMHAPEFQDLESTWRGLHYLCEHTSTGSMMKIKAFNAKKQDLIRDFNSAIDFDQSALFKKVYEEEFGTFGGAPLRICTSWSRCPMWPRQPMRRLLPRLRRTCWDWKVSPIWANRGISPKYSTRWNTPNGALSVTEKTAAMWG